MIFDRLTFARPGSLPARTVRDVACSGIGVDANGRVYIEIREEGARRARLIRVRDVIRLVITGVEHDLAAYREQDLLERSLRAFLAPVVRSARAAAPCST